MNFKMVHMSLAGLLFFVSFQAHSFCYERIYSDKHLAKYKNQEIQDVQFSWDDRWDDENERSIYPYTLTVHLVQSGEHKVGEAKGVCTGGDLKHPLWGSNDKQSDSLDCTMEGLPGSFIVKKSKSRYALGELTKGVLNDVSFGAKPGATLQVPEGDWLFGLDFSKADFFEACAPVVTDVYKHTVTRFWNEVILFSIRNDLARPTVTARNLYHYSALLWDVYAAFDESLPGYQSKDKVSFGQDLKSAREEALSYAAYVFLKERYKNAPSNVGDAMDDPELSNGEPDLYIAQALERVMKKMRYSLDLKKAKKNSRAAAFGIGMAEKVLATNVNDGSREPENYAYIPGELKNPNKDLYLDYVQSGINLPFEWDEDWNEIGGGDIVEQVNIDYWIPLSVPGAADQGGNEQESKQAPLTLFWGRLPTFSNLETYKSQDKAGVYFDPGQYLPTFENDREEFIKENLKVAALSSFLNPIDTEKDGVDFDRDGKPDVNKGMEFIDISPGAYGNNTLGTNDGQGRAVNPVTGQPYKPHLVKTADFYRSMAEFWADGPDSETPPGHWNTLANYTIEQIGKLNGEFKWKGQKALDREEYELRTYLTLNGALHDAAVVAWGIKGHYEGNRPISVLRKLADMAEKDPVFAKELIQYGKDVGLKLNLVTYEAEDFSPWGDASGDNAIRTKLVAYAWRGHPFLGQDVDGGTPDRRDFSFRYRDETSKKEAEYYDWDKGANGVGWILLDNWMPYQQQNFVTPPFPGFVSGHSTFSRAAAEVLTYTTGSEFFPGGLGIYKAPHLEFESNFDSEMEFQWATFYDASDQSGISRLYGGIHASYDDLPARKIGSQIGKEAAKTANQIFGE